MFASKGVVLYAALSDMDALPTLQLDSLIFLVCQGLQCGIVPAVAA